MKSFIREAAASTFLRHNIIFFSGTLAISVLNYLYYPVLGRLMEPADFGEVQTIISLFFQTAVFLQVLSLINIGIIKKYTNTAEQEELSGEVSRLALMLGAFVLINIMLFSPLLKDFFQFNSVLPFFALAMVLLVSIPLSFANSYLQAHKRFGDQSRSGIIGASMKLIAAVTLVLLGWAAFGAIFALVIADLLALWYSLSKNKRAIYFLRTTFTLQKPNLGKIKPELKYALIIFATLLSINVLLSLDILVVKHFFSPHDAGLYTGIATVARIIFFLSGSTAAVLLASVVLRERAHNWDLLRRSAMLVSFLGGGAFLIFVLFPKLVISLLFGQEYLPYAGLLPKLSLAILILSFANLIAFYCIALRRYLIAPLALLAMAFTMLLVTLNHATIGAVVNNVLLGSIVLLVLMIWGGRKRAVA